MYSCTSTLRLPPNAREQHKPPSKGSRWFSLAPSQRKASPLAQAKVLSFSTQPERGPRKSAPPREFAHWGAKEGPLSLSLSTSAPNRQPNLKPRIETRKSRINFRKVSSCRAKSLRILLTFKLSSFLTLRSELGHGQRLQLSHVQPTNSRTFDHWRRVLCVWGECRRRGRREGGDPHLVCRNPP